MMFAEDGICIRRKTGSIIIFFYHILLTCLLFTDQLMSRYDISWSLSGNI